MNYDYGSLDEIKNMLSDITEVFLSWSEDILDTNNLERLSLVGTGNSINSGWTNHSNDDKLNKIKKLFY